MCGIAGLAFSKSDLPNGLLSLRSGIDCLNHRGPDGDGDAIYNLSEDLYCAFAHKRLSIIDTSSHGSQPFESRDSSFSLTYNGEIYNYLELRRELETLGISFRTNSDTEVLLEALIYWGAGALDKIEGMYAFGFLDIDNKVLLLARDPFGIKPLYFAKVGAGFGFASEPRALRRILPGLDRLNSKVAANFLLFGSTEMSQQTFFDGVTSLLPGHLMKIKLDGKIMDQEPVEFWKPDFSKQLDIGFKEATEKFRELLFESVNLHLRSDVPVGAAISGGVDSSSLVSVMRELSPNLEIETFSYIAADPRVSEEDWVDLVVKSSRATPNKVKISESELFQRDLDRLIVAQGEPFSTLSIYAQFKVFELAKSKGIKVTLDGQGADEMLAGYQGYPESRVLSLLEKGDFFGLNEFMRNWPKWPGRSLRLLLGLGVSEFFPHLRKSRAFIKASQTFGFMTSHSLELFSEDIFKLSSENLNFSGRSQRYRGRRLAESLREALGPKGLSSLLRFADRNSMYSSIESRVPFLNRKLVEFSLSLPENYLISQSGETKSILRKALVGVVPQEILDRKDKIGFEASTANWGVGSPVLLEISKDLDMVPLINPDSAREALRSVYEGSTPLSSTTWRLINFARWVQLEGVGS